MAWYIVKSGGTATGDVGRVTSQPTGSFASLGAANYYSGIEAALAATTTPVAGDFIICSSVHVFDDGSGIVYNGPIDSGSPIAVSVDDTAMDQELAGASESAGAAADIAFFGNLAAKNMKFITEDDFSMSTSSVNSHFQAYNCELNLTGAGDKFLLTGDGTSMYLYDTDIIWDVNNSSGGAFNITSGIGVKMVGGSVKCLTGNLRDLVFDGGTSGGLKAEFYNVDLSNITGHLMKGLGATFGDDMIEIVIEGCDLNAGVTFKDEAIEQPNITLTIMNSSATSSAAEYQFYKGSVWGDVEDQDDSGIHRGESTAFESGTKVSTKVSTSARCSTANPLIFELPARFAALSNASTDTLRAYFASTTALTNQNFWLQTYAPDGTNKQHYNSYTTRNTDIFATGTAHTDDSGASTWKNGGVDLVGYNEYREDISTSGDPAADSVPKLFICIAEPSITIYIDTTIDVVA